MKNPSSRLAVAVLILASALACRADTSGLEVLEISEAASLAAAGDAVFCDANNADTRAKYGTIPGAVLLTGYNTYDAGGELPSGTRLVFYCHSPMCGAAADAARRAVDAGRTDVAVMPAGIEGWSDAGEPVERKAAS